MRELRQWIVEAVGVGTTGIDPTKSGQNMPYRPDDATEFLGMKPSTSADAGIADGDGEGFGGDVEGGEGEEA